MNRIYPLAIEFNNSIAEVIDDINVVAEAAAHIVSAKAAVQKIVAIAANEDVIAILATQNVIARQTLQRIVAAAPLNGIRVRGAAKVLVRTVASNVCHCQAP